MHLDLSEQCIFVHSLFENDPMQDYQIFPIRWSCHLYCEHSIHSIPFLILPILGLFGPNASSASVFSGVGTRGCWALETSLEWLEAHSASAAQSRGRPAPATTYICDRDKSRQRIPSFLIDFPGCSHLYHKNNNLFLKCVQKLVVKNRCCCMRWDNTNAGILFLYPIVQFPLNCKDRDTFEKCNWKAAERRCRRGFSLRLFRENRACARLTNNCIIVFGVSQQQSHQDRMENQKFAP